MNSFPPAILAKVTTLIVVFVLFGGLIMAQSTRPASFDQQTKVVAIDESVPFGYQYLIDISEFKFDSIKDADEYFDKLETQLVTYEALSASRIEIQLNLRLRHTCVESSASSDSNPSIRPFTTH